MNVDTEKLKDEYQRMVQGLRDASIARETDVVLANPGIILNIGKCIAKVKLD